MHYRKSLKTDKPIVIGKKRYRIWEQQQKKMKWWAKKEQRREEIKREVQIQEWTFTRRRANGGHREERVGTVTDTKDVVLKELKEQRFLRGSYQVFHKYHLKNKIKKLL